MSLAERFKYSEMKARHQNILRPWYKKWWGILILMILGLILVLLVASGFYIVDKVKQIQTEQAQISAEQQRQNYLNAIHGDGSNYYLGAHNPQVTIVEFGDFACPFCQEAAVGVKKLIAEYGNKIKIVFRDYPLHENSIDLALAARCAGEQKKFWEFHDELFARQNELTASGDELKIQLTNLAAGLKLNATQFSACLTEKRYVSQIREDYEDGEKLAIKGTPTWFVNNYSITGYLPTEKFEELVVGLIK